MPVTRTRSTAIFFALFFTFFAAATTKAQSAPDRSRNASASSEAPSDGSALSAFPRAFADRTIAANPLTWLEQCFEHLPGVPAAFTRSLRREPQPWPNDSADDSAPPSNPTAACATQQLRPTRAPSWNSPASQLVSPPPSNSSSPGSPSPGAVASSSLLPPALDATSAELASFGKPGAAIARARSVVLEILASGNACTAWYQTKDSTPAGTFQSLTFSIDRRGVQTISESPLPNSLELFRQPYVARATQDGGPYSEITINANGAFYRMQGTVEKFLDQGGGPGISVGTHLLTVGYYTGNTLEAQVVTLLHEFGHILDLLPPDADDLDGSSARNTDQVLRHCRLEVEAYSKRARESAKR